MGRFPRFMKSASAARSYSVVPLRTTANSTWTPQSCSIALSVDRDSVANLFADPDQGLIPQLESVLGGLVDFEGFIDGKTTSLGRRIDSIDVSRESMTRRIESFEARLLKEFNSLDTLVAQLQVSGNFLSQQLSLLQPTSNT